MFKALYYVLENIQIKINRSSLHQGVYDDEQITIPALHIKYRLKRERTSKKQIAEHSVTNAMMGISRGYHGRIDVGHLA